MNGTEKVKTKTSDGQTVEILLEDWVKLIIDQAFASHKDGCPFISEEVLLRMKVIETKMKIIQWVGSITGSAIIIALIGLLITNG